MYRLALTSVVAMLMFATGLGLSVPSWASDQEAAARASEYFDSFCLSKPPGFSNLDHAATEAHYQVFIDRSIPMPNGATMRQKNWLIKSFMGAPMMLLATDVTNGNLHISGCGIYAPDITGQSMEGALSSLPRMGPANKRTTGPGGSSVVWWSARVGNSEPSEDSQVMLSYDIPGNPGSNVNLIFKTHSDR